MRWPKRKLASMINESSEPFDGDELSANERQLQRQVEAIVPPGHIPFDLDAGPSQFVNQDTFPALFKMMDKLVENTSDEPFVLPDWRDHIGLLSASICYHVHHDKTKDSGTGVENRRHSVPNKEDRPFDR